MLCVCSKGEKNLEKTSVACAAGADLVGVEGRKDEVAANPRTNESRIRRKAKQLGPADRQTVRMCENTTKNSWIKIKVGRADYVERCAVAYSV